jgi:hypothetical protein
MRMIKDCPAVGVVAGSNFSAALAKALRDAAGALLREIDFVGEAANLRARLVFRRLILDPLFSGLSESIFHADPHAGNPMVQTQKTCPASRA